MVESALKKADAVSPMPKISREDLEKDGVFVGID
jgi:uridine nucleosidase